jgi:hypothetical protein
VKRYTFTCVLSYGDEVDDPEQYVNQALMYGDKHQDYFMWVQGDIKVEDQSPED